MIIKKIFDGVFDEEVHNGFLKFGKGSYRDKFLLECKKQTKKWNIKTGAEYVNSLVRSCLGKIDGEIKISGIIVSTLDLKDEIGFDLKKVSNFQGVRKHVVDTEVKPQEIFDLMDKYPRAFFALSFKGDNFILKIKAKAPTSGKPGKEKEDGPTADFCNLKIEDREIVKELFFGVDNFDNVKIKHEIEINEIVYPANVSELKPTEIREMAKRKGIIKRIINSDGKEEVMEANFVA